MPTHVALLRGINNLGSNTITMAELREVVTSLGHADVTTYIQSGNVLFTPRHQDAFGLAAELECGIASRAGVRARAVVLSRGELTCCVRDNPYPSEPDPRRLHGIFLPEVPGSDMAAWLAEAELQARSKGSRDRAQLLRRVVYLHTPDGYPRSELRRLLDRTGGPTSAAVAGTARNWATVSSLAELLGS